VEKRDPSIGTDAFRCPSRAQLSAPKLAEGHNQSGILGQITLASKPVFHCIPKLIERHIRSNFQQSIGHRQRVVKNGRVGEVAHAEIVDPFQRAGLKLPSVLVFHADFPGEHTLDLSTDIDSPRGVSESLASGGDRWFDSRHDAFQVLERLIDRKRIHFAA
jgi:hypothetical protein